MRSDQLTKFLYITTFAYLGIPYLIFFGGWIRQPFSTLFSLMLLVGALGALRYLNRRLVRSNEPLVDYSLNDLLLVLLLVLPVALVAGAGGWGFQDTDWYKHNAILRDLVTEKWPVLYEAESTSILLTYYIAYQLPAGLAGKILGWEAANHVLFFYTLIGLFLAALWIKLLTGSKSWWFIIVFLAFSGMDIIGQIVVAFYKEVSVANAIGVLSGKLYNWKHLEWWVGWGFAQFSSMAALIVWVPNQGIAGWMLTSLLVHDAKLKCLHVTGLFYLGLCALWAPFVGLGILPFILVIIVCQWRKMQWDRTMLRQMASWSNLAGLLLGLIVAFYLAGRFQEYVMPVEVEGLYQERITWTFLRLGNVLNLTMYAFVYLTFIILEFAVLHGLLYWYIKIQEKPKFSMWRNLLILSSAILIFLPNLNWGWNNEPSMRSSIPAIFVTALVTILVLGDPALSWRARWIKRAIVAILLVGSLTTIVELGRHVVGINQQAALVAIPQLEEVRTLFELQDQRYKKYYNFAGQYLGSGESHFLHYLGKK